MRNEVGQRVDLVLRAVGLNEARHLALSDFTSLGLVQGQ